MTLSSDTDLSLQNERALSQASLVREIALASIRHACHRWPVPSPFISGSELSMSVHGDRIRAAVFFDGRHIEVRMSAPVSITTGWDAVVSKMRTFFQPILFLTNPGGQTSATADCIRKAWTYLEELYCDYWLMDAARDTLRTKYEHYLEEKRLVEERETELNRPILDEIEAIRKEKILLKKHFKEGRFSEVAYKERRNSLIDLIEAKQGQLSNEDVFGRVFRDELLLLRRVDSGRGLIQAIVEGKL